MVVRMEVFLFPTRSFISSSVVLLVFGLLILRLTCVVTSSNLKTAVLPCAYGIGNAQQDCVIGQRRIICILVEFSDVRHSKSRDEIATVLDQMSRYWQEVSYGLLSIDTMLTDWLSLWRSEAFYGEDMLGVHDLKKSVLIEDAIRLADPTVGFGDYDFVMIVHSGSGQEAASLMSEYMCPEVTTRIWSSTIANASLSTDEGVTVGEVAVVPEEEKEKIPYPYNLAISEESYGLLGVYAHEFGHLLGLPDLYLEGVRWAEDILVGPWDLMASGAAIFKANRPSHLGAFCKVKLGWISPKTIILQDEPTIITIKSLEQNKNESVIEIPLSNSSYYLIELRLRVGFDDHLRDEGVVITLVHEFESEDPLVLVVDGNSSSSTLDDAAFHPGDEFNSTSHNMYLLVLELKEDSSTIALSSQAFRDTDQDALYDIVEQLLGTNPNNSDTDTDGLSDFAELRRYWTNPTKADTDSDGLTDGTEIRLGTSPFLVDSDGDYWTDGSDPYPTDFWMPNNLYIFAGVVTTPLPLAFLARKLTKAKNETHWGTIKYRATGVFLFMIGLYFCYLALKVPPFANYAWVLIALLIPMTLLPGSMLVVGGRPKINPHTRGEKPKLVLTPLPRGEHEEPAPTTPSTPESVALEEKLAYLEKELANLDWDFAVGKMDKETYEKELDTRKLREQIEQTEAEIAEKKSST